eukprot:3238835-Prymnesium_polylepis.1
MHVSHPPLRQSDRAAPPVGEQRLVPRQRRPLRRRRRAWRRGRRRDRPRKPRCLRRRDHNTHHAWAPHP